MEFVFFFFKSRKQTSNKNEVGVKNPRTIHISKRVSYKTKIWFFSSSQTTICSSRLCIFRPLLLSEHPRSLSVTAPIIPDHCIFHHFRHCSHHLVISPVWTAFCLLDWYDIIPDFGKIISPPETFWYIISNSILSNFHKKGTSKWKTPFKQHSK